MGILTPHWLQHLQASFKVTGTEAGRVQDGTAQEQDSDKDKPTLSHGLLEGEAARALRVRIGWGSGIELDSFQEIEEEEEKGRKRRGERRGLSWSRPKIQGGKHKRKFIAFI